MTILGLTGKKSSGKSTMATALLDRGLLARLTGWRRSGVQIGMIDSMKDMLRAYLAYRGADADLVERMMEGDLREVPSHYFCGKTPRWAQQSLGDWGRRDIGGSFWMDAFRQRVGDHDGEPIIICPNIRSPAEAQIIRDMGGMVVRVVNPKLPVGVDTHSTETLMDEIVPDATVVNDHPTAEAFSVFAQSWWRRTFPVMSWWRRTFPIPRYGQESPR